MKKLHKRRYADSRESYWKDLFNNFSRHSNNHSISGWSEQGLAQRVHIYFEEFSKLAIPKTAKILDLGCGAGVYTKILKQKEYSVAAVDFAWKVIVKARQGIQGNRLHCFCADVRNLPVKNQAFDHVLCIGLFQSLSDHGRALEEISRLLKPNALNFRMVSIKPVQILPLKLSKLNLLIKVWNSLPFIPYLTARSFLITAKK